MKKKVQVLRSGIFNRFRVILKLQRLQFLSTERLFHRDPPPHGTFAVYFVKNIHLSFTKAPKVSSKFESKNPHESGNFFEFLNPEDPRPDPPLVFFPLRKKFGQQRRSLNHKSTKDYPVHQIIKRSRLGIK